MELKIYTEQQNQKVTKFKGVLSQTCQAKETQGSEAAFAT